MAHSNAGDGSGPTDYAAWLTVGARLDRVLESHYTLSIFPNPDLAWEETRLHRSLMNWYGRWLRRQIHNIPPAMMDLMGGSSAGFQPVFLQTAQCMRTGCHQSIDGITVHLEELGLIRYNEKHDRAAGHTLVFAILGWQTMLYSPSFRACPPGQFELVKSWDGFGGQAYTKTKIDSSMVDDHVTKFLHGFGTMLPTPNTCVSDDTDERQAFQDISIIDPRQFNAYWLGSVAGIEIQWVDELALHLVFDKSRNTLYLYRRPSFCLASLVTRRDDTPRSVLHRCASQDASVESGACEADVQQLLGEVLGSYHLLFGNHKHARRYFLSLDPFNGLPVVEYDLLLITLCSKKLWIGKRFAVDQHRLIYHVRRDFPILRSRIVILHQHLSSMKPRGWRELWRDDRDTAQWYTFWAVIVFGGLGLSLAMVQVALQAAQLAASHV